MTQLQQMMFALFIAVSVGIGGILTGYHYGAMSVEVKQQKQVIAQTKTVRKDEAVAAEVINRNAKGFEDVKQVNKRAADKLLADLGGLRFQSADNRLPAIAASPGERTDDADRERSRAREVDFADVASEIAQLGRDYDDAVAQIAALNATLAADRRLCNVQ